MTELPPPRRYKGGRPATPEQRAVFHLLKDGEWHSVHEVSLTVGKVITPERAVREWRIRASKRPHLESKNNFGHKYTKGVRWLASSVLHRLKLYPPKGYRYENYQRHHGDPERRVRLVPTD